jgi:long-chain acyl-CoA synthetase
LLHAEPWETEVRANDLFGIYYTGGTTGRAKGVMLSHKNIVSNAVHLILTTGMRGDHVALHSAPMFHLADGAVNFAVTMVGGSHVTVKAFEPAAVLSAVEKERVTCALWVPTMINLLVNYPDVSGYDLSSMRLVFYGASPIAPDLLKRAIEVFNCQFIQLYGMTEAGPILTILLPEEHTKPELLTGAGRQAIGVEVRVVDEQGNDVPPGEVGEVIARGPNIMMGYWGKPLETEAVLRDGWYWTGDLARIDENHYIYIVDRAKDMIITGGENVYSVEVEAVLYKHPAVLEAAVVGVPDERWGEAVKAVVVVKPGAAVTEKELIDFCKQHIASYKAPKSVDFVEALPKSGAGKILKRVLREKYWAGHARRVH